MYSTSLKGKIAWVTGSSRGIGRTIAEFLAECGADVALHGRSDARLVQYQEGTTLSDAAEQLSARCGVRVLPVHADLGNEEEARRAAAEMYSAKRFAQEGKNSLLTSDRFAQTSCFNLIKTLYTFI